MKHMNKAKLLAGLAGGCVVLLGAVLLAVWLLVNPNRYKGRIEAAVKESTGRELKLPGDIKLSVFPWVALKLGPASLGNPPGFSDAPFLSFTHAALRVKLLPLLHQRLEVSRVELDGMNLSLLKNAQGRGNWQQPEAPAATTGAAKPVGSGLQFQSIADVRVTDGRVTYQNLSIENINLETGSITAAQDIPVSATFGVHGLKGAELTVNAKLDVRDADGEIRLGEMNISGTHRLDDEERPAHWDFTAHALTLNMTQQTLSAPVFAASYSSARLTGSVSAKQLFEDLSVTGSVELAPLVLREVAPRLGITLPKTRDVKALAALTASADFAYDAKVMSATHVQAHLDDTQLQGDFKLASGTPAALTFDLSADQIDLDRYRAPEGDSGELRAAGNGDGAAQKSAPQAAQQAAPLGLAGTLTVGEVHFSRVDLTHFKVTVARKDGVMHLFPIGAQLDGGRYSGDITWDEHGAVPVLSMDEHLSGIDMARLLANTAQKGRLSGRANIVLKATGRGATADGILKTLNGHLDANLADGALEGIDLAYELHLAQALIERNGAPGVDTGRTQFTAFKISAQISNGVAQTNDLSIVSPVLSVQGQGSVGLATQALDMKLIASIQAGSNIEIPLLVSGTYVNPKVKADVSAVAKDQLKNKLQDLLKKNGLQGLFGK